MAGKRKAVQNDATTLGVAGPMYFYEDEVYRVTKSGDVEFGMVTENWEMYSSDEEDSDPEKVPTGSVAVTWHPKGKDDVVPETKVKLSDRSLMPGDVVRRLIAGKDTQRGYCRAVKVAADVQIIGAKKVIPQVLAVELQPVQKFQMDVAVYLDSWIGMVRDMHYKVYMRFSDGSACSIDSRKIIDKFEDTRKSAEVYVTETFYPGQKLQGPMRHLKDAEWSHMSEDLKRAKDRKSVSVTVTDVKPMSMHVQWQSQTPESAMESNNRNNKDSKNNWERDPPPDWLDEKDLNRVKSLNLFESCTVQLGDVSFYTPKSVDEVIEKTTWKKQLLKNGIHRAAQDSKKDEAILSDKQALSGDDLDADVATDVENGVSDTGNEEETVKPKDPATHATKKALPKLSTRSLRKKKLKKAKHHQTSNTNVASGAPVVVETIHTQSTVDVVWQDGTIEEGMRSTDLYPIHHLDDHEFFPGDFVVRADSMDFRSYGVIQYMDHSGRVALVKWFEVVDCNDAPKELTEEEMSVYDIKDHPDYRFRPGTIVIRIANVVANQFAAGQILDNYPDGQVRVWWANGAMNSCWPQDLFRLGEYDSDEGELWDDNASMSDNADDNASTDSWETEAEEVLNESDSSIHKERYQTIGKLIKKIQEALVCIRETIVASSPVVVPSAEITANRTLNVDRRGITKKLLMIYKDCQYLDKIMGSKHFDEQFLKQWFKQMESSSKSGIITADITKLFEIPDVKQSPLARSESLTESVDLDRSKTDSSNLASIYTESLDSSLNTSTSSDTKVSEDDPDASSQTIFVTELCSLILQKLLSAHKEYETRFGSKASETIKTPKASDPLRIMATIAEEFMEEGPTTPIVNKIAELCSRAGAIVCDLTGTDDFSCRKSEESPSKPEENLAEESPVPAGPLKLSEELGMSKISVNNNALDSCMSIKFSIVDAVPDTHRYRLTSFMPSNQKAFIKTIQKEIGLLQNSLPDGIFVKGYEDRMDLFSVMICGPENTPYEDGLFFFDIQLPPTYPSAPPSVHYVSFCPDRLNPNLYECGKVCVSLLGTWNGKGTEVWTSSSSLLQLLISIQGLILVPEPYYNEAGYEKQRGSQQGEENSRMYNEMVLIKLVQSMSRMLINRHAPYETEIGIWITHHYQRLIERYNLWLEMSEDASKIESSKKPGFVLLPVSKGFAITLKKTLDNFAKLCDSALGSNDDEPLSN